MPVSTRSRMFLTAVLAFATLGPTPILAQNRAPAVLPPLQAEPLPPPEPDPDRTMVAFAVILTGLVGIAFAVLMMKRQREIMAQYEESMAISRRMLEIAERSHALDCAEESMVISRRMLEIAEESHALDRVEESMVISRRILEIAEESLALHKETVRLLARTSETPTSP